MSGTLTNLKYTDTNGLQSKLLEELRNLRKKEHMSYWPRFMIRRISLYAIPFLMFFTFFFCLSLTKKVGLDKVNAMLGAQNVPAKGYLLLVVVFFTAVLFAQWWFFNREYSLQAAYNVIEIPKKNYKFVAQIVLVIPFVYLFLYIYNTEYKVFYGFLTFLVLTICPLLIDRTLGLTRQNERFKLYIRRLQRFDELNIFREQLNIEFNESDFLDYMKLVDEADHSKNQDTVSDTSYFMTLIENKLKG